MSKSHKTYFYFVSILNIFFAGVFVLTGVSVIFNLFGLKDIYVQFLTEYLSITSPAQIQSEIYIFIFDCLIGLCMNVYIAVVLLKLANRNDILIGANKSILYLTILQCLFGLSIICGVLGIICAVLLKQDENTAVLHGKNLKNTKGVVEESIELLKEQLDKGKITKEQYDRALNDIIEEVAKEKMQK